ncbi:serine protease [Pseudonocardiaceae bacterium YIM PH 21723]|nr:serine protease [Pseudonocardiaceae bacterium YIM PH 21723]
MKSALVLALGSVLALSAPAVAAAPGGQLTLTKAADLGTPHSVTLDCDPVGGTHPQAKAACATLTEVNGDIDAIKPIDIACPDVYKPETVTAVGVWNGRRIDFSHRYTNSCHTGRATHEVFAF